ncbi:MAG TPA: hypothetical protein VFY05_10900, partial [Candidatus Angelobacter sp.]|nr:hypothetical protein [Candidatus Angelobacter sp.]
AEQAGIIDVAQADGGKAGAALLKLLKVLAQLRDMLRAENSTIVPEKDDHRRRVGPQGTEMHRFAIDVRQGDGGKSCAIALSHGGVLSCSQRALSSAEKQKLTAD